MSEKPTDPTGDIYEEVVVEAILHRRPGEGPLPPPVVALSEECAIWQEFREEAINHPVRPRRPQAPGNGEPPPGSANPPPDASSQERPPA